MPAAVRLGLPDRGTFALAGAISILRARRSTLTALSFAAIIALAWFAYAPGLSGGFLFDDYANLPALGAYGRIDNATAFLRYITSGAADPTGRPLALLSFLVDARNWPADPWPFKRTSVILHLANGTLLALVLLRLGRTLRGGPDRAGGTASTDAAAVLGAGLWTLHPLFLSTTLYVVQREAMLPATCILLGLLGYLHGRAKASADRGHGIGWAAASIVGFTLLGILCKANGALLPLLILTLEYALLDGVAPLPATSRGKSFRTMRRVLLAVPAAALIAYFVYAGARGLLAGSLADRPWTLGQRLLTEPRVLVDYLQLLWLPRPYSRGVFNDGYAASTGLLSPPSTLICIAVVVALLAFAVRVRRRHPALALAILFFFVGHLMESSVIAIELYFEHRNYVPSLLMFWPLALWLCAPAPVVSAGTQTESRAILFARRFLTVALPLLLAGLTYVGAGLWGNVADQGLLWAARNPDSPRAQAYAAQIEIARGHSPQAVARLRAALSAHPDEIQLGLNLVDAECASHIAPDMAAAATSLRTTRKLGRLAYDWIVQHLAALDATHCSALDLATLEHLVEAVGRNPQLARLPGRKQDVENLRGRIALRRNQGAEALVHFNAAFDADPSAASALQQAATLAAAGRPDLALLHLDHLDAAKARLRKPAFGMPAIHAWLLDRDGYWDGEARRLRGILGEDARHMPAPTP